MLNVVPFKVEHVSLLADPRTEPGLYDVMSRYHSYWQAIEESESAYSAWCEGDFLGSAGFHTMPWRTCIEAWLWAGDAAAKYPQQVHKCIARAIRSLEKDHGIKRIYVNVRTGNAQAVRWIKLLGFCRETTMVAWGPDGTDFDLYARVRR